MEQIWWERVPNAMAFAAEISRHLIEGKSILLQYDQSIPWYDSLTDLMKGRVKQEVSTKSFEEVRGIEAPGPYLLQNFCKAEKRALYRPTKTFARFFAERDDIVLHSRYFWVTLDSREALGQWEEFVSEYAVNRGRGKETAVFILEWQGERMKSAKKGIRVFAFHEYISAYDCKIFSMLASSGIKEEALIKNYVAELASHMAGRDAELCGACIKRYKELMGNPYGVLQDIVQGESRSNGSPFVFLEGQREAEHGIWLAQIKTIYPVLEEFRGKFVEQYQEEIKGVLPMPSSWGMYEEPGDVELGALVYLAEHGTLQIPSGEYHQLKKFRDARNKLSHLNTLSEEEIRGLL